MPRISNIPNKIISLLQKNPTATREEIRKALGVSYQAIQKHLQELERKQLVSEGFIVLESKSEKKYKFWIMIETVYSTELDINDSYGRDYQKRLCDEIFEELIKNDKWSNCITFNQIDIVFAADWDIILSVISDNAETVGSFITQYLRTHSAVSRTSTSWSP